MFDLFFFGQISPLSIRGSRAADQIRNSCIGKQSSPFSRGSRTGWGAPRSLPIQEPQQTGRGVERQLSLPGFNSKENISCNNHPCDRRGVKPFPLHAHGVLLRYFSMHPQAPSPEQIATGDLWRSPSLPSSAPRADRSAPGPCGSTHSHTRHPVSQGVGAAAENRVAGGTAVREASQPRPDGPVPSEHPSWSSSLSERPAPPKPHHTFPQPLYGSKFLS